MDWDKCSNRARLEAAGQLGKGAGWQEQPLRLFIQHTAVPGRAVRASAIVSSDSAWAEVEWSINKILFVTKLMELPAHSPEVDLPAHKKVKCYTAPRGTLPTAPPKLGVTLGERREG